ncbi:MAG: PstS family phosphate ABC transporter substrate-binding protein [Cyanobacteria bacterium SZAS TMP-1]|nr:PstS family phosphate ABC transporter substrate-binding protein [Cyanobacteria bacterium SZAS TMP-1]
MSRLQQVKVFMAVLSAGCALTLAACSAGPRSAAPAADNGPSGNQLSVQGSDTMAKLVENWAADYQKAHPQSKITVQSGDTGSGIKALVARRINVAAASRELTPEENMQAHDAGVRLMRLMVARDAVAVIVSPANPVGSVTLDDLKAIYSGKLTNWSQLKGKAAAQANFPIVALGREITSGTGAFLREQVLHGEEFGSNVKLLSSTSDVVDTVEKQKGAVGFIGISQAEEAGKKVKVVTVRLNAAADDDAKEDTINGVDYPLSRPLYMYCDVNAGELTKSFIEFCKSAEGQKSVKKLGFLPLF